MSSPGGPDLSSRIGSACLTRPLATIPGILKQRVGSRTRWGASRRRTLPSAAPTGQDLRIRTRRPDRRARPTRRNGDPPHSRTSRRRALGVAAAVLVASMLIAACGGSSESGNGGGSGDAGVAGTLTPAAPRDLLKAESGRAGAYQSPSLISDPGGQGHLRHPGPRLTSTRVPAVPGRVGHPNDDFTQWTIVLRDG